MKVLDWEDNVIAFKAAASPGLNNPNISEKIEVAIGGQYSLPYYLIGLGLGITHSLCFN